MLGASAAANAYVRLRLFVKRYAAGFIPGRLLDLVFTFLASAPCRADKAGLLFGRRDKFVEAVSVGRSALAIFISLFIKRVVHRRKRFGNGAFKRIERSDDLFAVVPAD